MPHGNLDARPVSVRDWSEQDIATILDTLDQEKISDASGALHALEIHQNWAPETF